tara:strand:+ start:864 stop:1124 length:261 start_codon:yes stop_codon:yes gene_type:complete
MTNNRVLEKRIKNLDPEANPFTMKKPIDIANEEIKVLKKSIMELRSEMTLLKNMLIPVRKEYLKRMADEEEREKDMVIENKSWWWG